MPDDNTPLQAALSDRYRIEREIGEGGMATVYLARDLKHNRNVALKVLRPELSAVVGGDRFLAEIETTANLQHPHILPLYDSGTADSLLYYVMPYVEGETIRDRLDREKQLPVDEAVGIAVAVAGALDYAHQHGVVHRDIKPANILIQAGQPVVGDFGIALAVGAAGGARLTETGLSVGTPYYMSPEQATGDLAVGPPSDIYALGCVLYEMLTGEPPYTGGTAQAVLGRIIQGVPVSATTMRTSVPPNVDAAIRKALEKIPADRFTVARDFAAALADASFRHGETAEAVSGDGAVRWRRTASAAGALAALLALALGWAILRPPPPPPVARYGLAFAPGQEPMDVLFPTLALAPDGSAIVYVGPGGDAGQLWSKPRDRFEATPLAGTDGALSPSVSPDGSAIMYQVGGQLRKIPFAGGASVTMADSVNTTAIVPVAWLDDGTVVYVDSSWHLRRMPGEGGSADVVWTPPGGRYPVFPKPLPGSGGLLFTLCNANCTEFFEIWVLDLDTGEARSLVPGSVMAEYTATGHLLFVRTDGSAFAQRFDLGLLQVEGAAVPVLEGMKVDGAVVPDLALSPGGTLLFRTGAAVSRSVEFVWVTTEGVATPVHPGWSFDAGDANRGWSLSPDGTRLAARIRTEAGHDIWVKELPRGPLSRLTFYEGDDRMPRWSPDGSSVTFLSDRGGDTDLWSARSDGVGEPTLLYDHEVELAQGFWTPDGAWLVLRTAGVGGQLGGRDILAVRPDVDSVPIPLLAADFDESAPAVSPDSRWIAYRSNETGRSEVFVRPFPDVGGGKWQVSTAGGTGPLWAHGGGELFYINGQRELVSARVETEGSFRVEERRVLFRLGEEYALPGIITGIYDISPDDERFLFVRLAGSGGQEDVSRMILVENWFEELRAMVGR